MKLIPILLLCLKIEDSEVQYYTYHILSDITYSSERVEVFQEKISREDLELILGQLLHAEDRIRMVIIRFICNLLSSDNLNMKVVLY